MRALETSVLELVAVVNLRKTAQRPCDLPSAAGERTRPPG
jgi:hypothetical protein